MITVYKQRGATFVFWVFFLALIGFLLMIGIKLFPVYYKGFTTQKIVEDIAVEMQGKKPTKKQLWQSIDKRININSVYGVDKNHFVFERNKDAIDFGLDYEVRIPIIANLDAIAKFDQRQTIITKK
ncbi:MAG: DUF4845 domain-containing protein [Gammaproteobacteria bacterium]|nr:DUF4845 domain-containing protein [Gammaproteobacteria bacterium]NNC67441.1 DUF4845 domain-containing protein [Gammaproteobacteria bacterium]